MIGIVRVYVLAACFLYCGAGFWVASWRAYDSRSTDPLAFRILCFPIDLALWPFVVKYWKRG